MIKLRPVAKTETIRGLLQERLDKYNEAIGTSKSKLEELQKPGIIHMLDRGAGADALKAEIQYLETDIQNTKDQMLILQSHQAPAIAVEFEL